MFCDPSGKQSILDLAFAGIPARTAQNNVEEGIRAVYERFAAGRLLIFRGRCPNLVRELTNYRRADNGTPVKEDDHAADALRYLVMGVNRPIAAV